MSKIGVFAARYEHLQRGLLDVAQRRLNEAQAVLRACEEQLVQCTAQRVALRVAIATAREGWRIRDLSEQSSVASIVEMRAEEAVAAALTGAAECLANVRQLHQDAERWATVVEQEADRTRIETQRVDVSAADEWAVLAHGRPSV